MVNKILPFALILITLFSGIVLAAETIYVPDPGGSMMMIWGILAFLALVNLAISIWVLVDIFGSTNSLSWKIMWIGIIWLFGIFGLLGYIFIGRSQKNE